MNFNNFSVPPVLFLHLNKKLKLERRRTVGMRYIIFPAVLHISKYMRLVFYLFFKICICVYISIFFVNPVPVNSGWHISSGMCTTV